MIDLPGLFIAVLIALIVGGVVTLNLRKGDTYIVTHHSPTVNVNGEGSGGAGGAGFLIPFAKLVFTVILLVTLLNAVTGALSGIGQFAQGSQAAPAVAPQVQSQPAPVVVSPPAYTYEPPIFEKVFSLLVNGIAVLGGLAAGAGMLALAVFVVIRIGNALGLARTNRSDPLGQIDDVVAATERRMDKERA